MWKNSTHRGLAEALSATYGLVTGLNGLIELSIRSIEGTIRGFSVSKGTFQTGNQLFVVLSVQSNDEELMRLVLSNG